ncbi:MAG: phosphoglucosamine mutase [Myxococcota bacterium]
MEASKRKLFGTDGIRGVANQYPMTCEVALALGRAVAHQARQGEHRHRILIGKDTRLSGYMIEMAFASGVCSMGVDALMIGPMPTPAVAFLTRDMRCDAGVMISASHNPYEDNGIKIFARDGFKLPDEKELELERFMEDDDVGAIRPTREAVGKAGRIADARGRYIAKLKHAFPAHMGLEGLRIVVDCANGAAYRVAPTVLSELGAEVKAIGTEPDGRNINREVGALHINNVQTMVRETRADLGIALDGDADRIIVVDDKAQVLDGDVLLAIGAEELMARGELGNNTVVATVMSNLALDHYVKGLGGSVVRTQVGDRYVVGEMRKTGCTFGGEQSGHLVYLDHSTTGDGMLAGLKLLSAMKRQGAKASDLREKMTLVPQHLLNIKVREKKPLEELPSVQDAIAAVENELGDAGRVLVRFSGTEAKARVLVEGPEARLIERLAKQIASEIRRALG